jgi:hypothetical protein
MMMGKVCCTDGIVGNFLWSVFGEPSIRLVIVDGVKLRTDELCLSEIDRR